MLKVELVAAIESHNEKVLRKLLSSPLFESINDKVGSEQLTLL